jgi:hypothetical protein
VETELQPPGCATDLDCPLAGFTCQDGYCANALCPAGTGCTGGTADLVWMSLTDVGAPDSLDVAQCGALSVNSNDAAACLAHVESVLGQSCTPLP